MIGKIGLVFRLAMQDLRGAAAANLISAAIISAAFATLGLFLLASANLEALAGHWQEKVRIIVYLDGDPAAPERERLRAWLLARPEVEGAEYVSKDLAMGEFRSMLGADAGLLDGLVDNPLPASFTLRLAEGARDMEKVKALSADIAAVPGVDGVDHGGDWLEGLGSALSLIERGVVVVGTIMAVAVVFIISNAIRLNMYSRRDEIGIMRLVGAGPLMVRAPFLVEGVAQGTVASAVGAMALYALYRAVISGAASPGALAGFSPVFISSQAVAAMILGGALMGAAASAVRFKGLLKA